MPENEKGMLDVSVREARGVVADLLEKLGGPDGREWFIAAKRFLRKEEPWGWKADWERFYKELFGLEINLSGLVIPAKKKGFDRLIVVAPGMTPQRLYGRCSKLFPCWTWLVSKSFDEAIAPSDRVAGERAYAIWIRDRITSDEELIGFSASALEEKGVPGITLEERLIYELKFFKETKRHLDVVSWTLCSGSRYFDGRVPEVSWAGNELWVGWRKPDFVDSYWRSREVVS